MIITRNQNLLLSFAIDGEICKRVGQFTYLGQLESGIKIKAKLEQTGSAFNKLLSLLSVIIV